MVLNGAQWVYEQDGETKPAAGYVRTRHPQSWQPHTPTLPQVLTQLSRSLRAAVVAPKPILPTWAVSGDTHPAQEAEKLLAACHSHPTQGELGSTESMAQIRANTLPAELALTFASAAQVFRNLFKPTRGE